MIVYEVSVCLLMSLLTDCAHQPVPGRACENMNLPLVAFLVNCS